MYRVRRFSVILFLCGAAAYAQTGVRRSIRATGDASVSMNPDIAYVSVGVTTQATTAQEAAAQNASVASAVIAAVKQAIGANADVRTISYSISPMYRVNTSDIIGFTVNNIVQATIPDVSMAGKVIDAATGAGANRVQGITFSLKDSSTARAQALRMAAARARTQVEAIAAGLGVSLGGVISASEGSTTPIVRDAGVAAAPATPIEAGSLTITATVTLEVEIAR
jgi:uncharacterized protein